MRKILLSCGISLDGYIARPDGGIDFLIMPPDAAKMMEDFFATIDTIIMGRKTLAEAPAGGASQGPWKTYVFSRSLPPGERDGLTFVNESPEDFVRELRKQPGKNVFHMGGGQLACSFLEADLIDELLLGMVPVLIGKGIPLFPRGFPQRDFELVENKTYSQGLVALTYRRIRAKSSEEQAGGG